MSAARKIYHVDDNATARRVIGNTLRAVAKEEVVQFGSGNELTKALAETGDSPFAVFTDVMMPGMTGHDVLDWIKRSPKLHSVPVILVTAEQDQKERDAALRLGAAGYLTKPLENESVSLLLGKIHSMKLAEMDLRGLDVSFAEETLESMDELHKLIRPLTTESLKSLYRQFHTIKGAASSIQYPTLANFIHEAETFLSTIQNGNLHSSPPVYQVLLGILGALETQCEQIKKGVTLDSAPEDIQEKIKTLKSSVSAGWTVPGQNNGATAKTESTPTPERQKELDSENKHVVSKNSTSIRVKNESLDMLQGYIKRILQLRVRLSGFANSLQSEFSDEAFPQDLQNIATGLTEESTKLMEFFINLRVIPATRLKTFGMRMVSQTCEALGKPAHSEFDIEAGLEIDQAVIEALETAFTHIIRNSVDHGFETPEERMAAGKDPTGKINFKICREPDDKILAVISDDGKGIDRQKLKSAIAKKNLISADQLAALPEQNLLDLIFVDGLSTKDEISTVSGRGVGLGSVKESFEKLGGSIQVESAAGKGTTFIMKAPRYFHL